MLGHRDRLEGPVAVPRDPPIDLADLSRHRPGSCRCDYCSSPVRPGHRLHSRDDQRARSSSRSGPSERGRSTTRPRQSLAPLRVGSRHQLLRPLRHRQTVRHRWHRSSHDRQQPVLAQGPVPRHRHDPPRPAALSRGPSDHAVTQTFWQSPKAVQIFRRTVSSFARLMACGPIVEGVSCS